MCKRQKEKKTHTWKWRVKQPCQQMNISDTLELLNLLYNLPCRKGLFALTVHENLIPCLYTVLSYTEVHQCSQWKMQTGWKTKTEHNTQTYHQQQTNHYYTSN